MIFTRHRFLFIHVPKTGGNSVQDALRGVADDEIVCTAPHHDGVERFEVRSPAPPTEKHSTLADYERACGPGVLDGFFKFCGVRNLWSRCVSHYFSPNRGPVAWDRNAFIAFVENQVRPLEDYVDLARMDLVMRFESLQEGFDAALPRALAAAYPAAAPQCFGHG